jgi:hypothetical protein
MAGLAPAIKVLFSALALKRNAGRERALLVIKSHSALCLSDPRIGGRERLVDGLLHVIEDDQPDCGKDDGSNASRKKSLHSVLPLRYSFRLYSK